MSKADEINFKSFQEVVNGIAKLAEENGYDDYYFYSQIINGDYLVKTFFEEYFKKTEGIACCADKANYVLGAIKIMIQQKQNISLQQTYREYQEKGGNIGNIKELDEIAYWCPRTIKTSKEAIEIFYKSTIQNWGG